MTADELRQIRDRLPRKDGRRGWSQERLARALGVSQPAISQMEAGKTRVTRRTARQVRGLEVDHARA